MILFGKFIEIIKFPKLFQKRNPDFSFIQYLINDLQSKMVERIVKIHKNSMHECFNKAIETTFQEYTKQFLIQLDKNLSGKEENEIIVEEEEEVKKDLEDVKEDEVNIILQKTNNILIFSWNH